MFCTVADWAQPLHLGENSCKYRNDANSKTQTKVKTNATTKSCCKKQKQMHKRQTRCKIGNDAKPEKMQIKKTPALRETVLESESKIVHSVSYHN